MKRQLILFTFILLMILSACEPLEATMTYQFETDGGTHIEDIQIKKKMKH